MTFSRWQLTGYDIRQQVILWFGKVIHIHVASGSPLGSGYMAQSGTYEHQSTLAVRKSADCFGSAFDLSIQPFNGIIGPDSGSVLRWKVHVG